MSLINKMLKDLDTRTGGTVDPAGVTAAHTGLRPVPSPRRHSWRGAWITGLVIAGLAAGLYGGYEWGLRGEPATPENARDLTAAPKSKGEDTASKVTRNAPGAASAGQADKPMPPQAAAGKVVQPSKPEAQEAVLARAGLANPEAVKDRAHQTPAAATSLRPLPSGQSMAVSGSGAKTTRRTAGSRQAKPSRESSVSKRARPPTAEEQAGAGYQQAQRSLQQARPLAAEQQLRKALEIDPAHIAARELLVSLLLSKGQWQLAQQQLQHGLDAAPKHYRFAQVLARLHAEHGEDQQALMVLAASRVQAAGDPEYLALMAAIFQRAGQHADAARAYRQAVTVQPRQGKWWLGMAISLEAENNVQAAREAYHRAATSGLDGKLRQYAEQRLAALQ